MDRFAELLTTMVQYQTRLLENTSERARKVGATNFDGTGDPDSASSWLNELECVFRVISQASVKQPMGSRQQSGGMGRCRRPLCQTCGKNHEGKCHWGTSGCYQCGQARHLKRDCPELVQRGNEEKTLIFQPMQSGVGQIQGQKGSQAGGSTTVGKTQASVTEVGGSQQRGQLGRPHTQARVFTMTQQDAKTTPDVVTSMFTIFGHDVHVLSDPGSTHSFVSRPFAEYANIE
ncbi:hypothetical protein Dsin_014796 [Dipteronia sinensis]|uniref:CCHC-type domain-containing protein n=1 Tax=Dipteronia sinensis TaxID=43782 RepID=A0AAE0AMG2_9ROSI|nr:hypothetical protein Dsin_014796 [Dipteronia sinensis]